MQETQAQSLGWEDPLEKEMAAHSSILGWRIPWTEGPGGLQSVEWQRVGHSLATNAILMRPQQPFFSGSCVRENILSFQLDTVLVIPVPLEMRCLIPSGSWLFSVCDVISSGNHSFKRISKDHQA